MIFCILIRTISLLGLRVCINKIYEIVDSHFEYLLLLRFTIIDIDKSVPNSQQKNSPLVHTNPSKSVCGAMMNFRVA